MSNTQFTTGILEKSPQKMLMQFFRLLSNFERNKNVPYNNAVRT